MGFQTRLNRDLPIGIEGDFASTNPYHTVLTGEEGFRAAKGGVTIGRFAWADAETGLVTNAKVEKGILGFVRRDNTALIAEYLAESSLVIPEGFGITLYDKGDFWGRFAAGATIGQKVLANTQDGSLSAADAETAATESESTVDTGFIVASTALAGELAKITR